MEASASYEAYVRRPHTGVLGHKKLEQEIHYQQLYSCMHTYVCIYAYMCMYIRKSLTNNISDVIMTLVGSH